tara:strand:- start:2856 stop:5048 length:2193 start_codon:yes stop_codon:yes gene_type:complete
MEEKYMAYKFQLGAFVASGSITAEDGLDAGDSNITNVGNIALDSISADGNDMEINMTDARSTAFVIKEDTNLYLRLSTADGSEGVEIHKDLEMQSGTKFIMPDVTSGKILVADGTSYEEVAMSGDVAIAAGGATTIQANAVEGSMLNNNIVSGLDDIGAAIVATDEMIISDGGTIKRTDISRLSTYLADEGLTVGNNKLTLDVNGLGAAKTTAAQADIFVLADSAGGDVTKKITFSNLEDQIFGNVSSQASIAAGGALSLAVAAITSQTEMTGDVADADELMISDDGVLKRLDFSVLRDAVFTDVSGDATVASGGALTIANDAVEQAMIADDAVGADQLASNAVVNASVASNAAIALSKIDTNVDMGGNFTIGSQADDTATFTGGVTVGGNLTVNGSVTSVNSTTINITSSFTFEGPADDHETVLSAGSPTADTTITLPTIAAGTYHVAVLADATTAAAAAVTAAEFALLDGGSSVGTTALASGDGFLHNDNGTMKHTSINKLADFQADDGLQAASGKLAVSLNNLGASKTTVAQADSLAIVDSEGSNITKKITFSNFEDEIFGNVSGDIAIAAGGAATIQANAVEGSMLNNNIVSGLDDIGAAIVATDEMIVSDAGTIKRTDMSRVATFVGDNLAVNVQNVADSGTLQVGVNYFSDMSADGEDTVTLPASPSVGQSVKVKAPSDCSTARFITIARAGSQLIDGAASIRLESPFAAVELVYVAADIWRVF